jgi:hypothetical protein
MKTRFVHLAPAGLLALFAALSASPLSAQAVAPDPDALGVTFSFSASGSGKTDLESGNTAYGDVRVNDYAVAVEQEIGEGLSVGVGYELHELSLGSGANKAPLPDRLQSLSASLSYRRPINERWMGMLFVSPGYHFAGTRVASKGFGVTTGLLASHQYSETLSYSIGVAYDSLASSNYQVLPIGGLEWKFAPQWTLAIGFPRTGISYDFSENLQFGLNIEGNFGNYYVREDPQPGAANRPALNNTRLEYTEARVGFSATYKLTPTMAVSATIGTTLDREFDYHRRDFKLKGDDATLYGSVACNFSF